MGKIAILGANRMHLPLILKAREMGLETYCFAWAKGSDGKEFVDHYFDVSITDHEKIAEICQKESIDGIISNALEPAVPTMAYVSEKLGLNGISYDAALRARNKHLMRQKISEKSACFQPQFQLFDGSSSVDIKYPVIVKPIDGSCSNGVTLVYEENGIEAAIKRAQGATGNSCILIEQFIQGIEVSVESISFHGKHYVLVVTDKETTGAPYFVETAHHQPSALSPEIIAKIKQATESVLNALELTNGASHAEFKIDNADNVFFIEVGARGGGDYISYNLVQLSTGYDYVKGMIEVAMNRFHPPSVSMLQHSGVYFLSKDTANIKEFIQKHKDEQWVIDYKIDDQPLLELRKSQDRSGYIIYQSTHKIEVG